MRFDTVSQVTRPTIDVVDGEMPKGYYFMSPYKIRNVNKGSQARPLIIFNERGEILYYKYCDLVGDFKLHANGIISYFSKSRFYLMDNNFKIIDSVACVGGIETDAHDLCILKNGNYVLMGYENRTEDYSNLFIFQHKKVPGSKRARVKHGVIQELDKNRKLLFTWSTKDVFNAKEGDPFFVFDSLNVDLVHFNSIDIDNEGNYIVSARNFNEVFKLRKKDGAILWRMGGRKNSIRILNDTVPFFGQHDVRYTGENRFTLFDNGKNYDSLMHNARALEYVVNDSTKTAELIWSYKHPNTIISDGNGGVQTISPKLRLINYGRLEKGSSNVTSELIDYTNRKQLALISFKDTMATYRSFYYEKLPFKIKRDKIKITHNNGNRILTLKNKHRHYRWSSGEIASEIKVKKPGTYFVYYSDDGINYFSSNYIVL